MPEETSLIYSDGLTKLAQLTNDETEKVFHVLREAAPNLPLYALSMEISKSIGQKDPDEVHPIIRVLFSFYNTYYQTFPMLDVSSFVSKALTKLDLSFDEEVTNVLFDRLSRFFSLPLDRTLGAKAKALGLLTEHDKIYLHARIVSDLRPVFGAEISAGPVATTIVHTLKINYESEETDGAFFVALDSKDLQELRLILDRALEKDRALKAFAEKCDVTFLSIDSIEENSGEHNVD